MTIAFTYTRRPARGHRLPDQTNLAFMLGGVVRPADQPSVRVRSASDWQTGSIRYVVYLANNDQQVGTSSAFTQGLKLAAGVSLHGAQPMAWCSRADATDAAFLRLATQLPLLEHDAAWSIAAQVAQRRVSVWVAALSRCHDASDTAGLLRDLAGLAGERLWHVNLHDRPFDPRYDLMPPLHQLPGLLLMANLSPGNQVPAPDTIRFDWHHDTSIRSIYPRNSAIVSAGMGISAEADNQSFGMWGSAGWFSHGGQPGWGDDSNGEIGNMDPPVEPMEAPYHVMNSIQVFALVGTDKIPVEVDGLSIKYLIEGHAWEITGTVYGRTAANYLRPTANGPAHLQFTINGWTWLTAVKRYTRNKKFPSESYQFTALSRSGLLDGDWVGKRTVTLSSSMSAWQLIDQLLQPLGFSIERPSVAEWVQTPDWTVQAGSVSWAGATPMDVVKAVAKSAGAIVIADREHDVLHVYPRYRVSPWLWPAAPASAWSHIIPDAMIVDETGEPQMTTQLERVLVAGTTHGVITDVVLSGSAGAVSADDVTDPLAQDVMVNAERGRNIIGESGSIELLTIKIPLLPPGMSPALLVPGDLVKIQRLGGVDDNGLVLGTAIVPDGMSAVWQTVSVEVHHGNS